MKYIFILLFSTSSFIFSQKPCAFKEGLQEGNCKHFYENGAIEEVSNWEKGKLAGDAIFYYENGKIQASGEYQKGYKVKEWVYFDTNGALASKEIFRNGEQNTYHDSSTATYYSPSGVIVEVSNYKFGKLHGESKLFYDDGKSVKQIGYYENGIATGKWKMLYPSGKIQRETEFVNNKWNGTRVHYREDGSIEKTEVYKDRKLISTK